MISAVGQCWVPGSHPEAPSPRVLTRGREDRWGGAAPRAMVAGCARPYATIRELRRESHHAQPAGTWRSFALRGPIVMLPRRRSGVRPARRSRGTPFCDWSCTRSALSAFSSLHSIDAHEGTRVSMRRRRWIANLAPKSCAHVYGRRGRRTRRSTSRRRRHNRPRPKEALHQPGYPKASGRAPSPVAFQTTGW